MRLLIAVLIAALATIGQAQAPASPFLTSGAEVCCGTQSPGTNSWRTETAARGTTSAPDRAAFGQMPDVRGIAAPAAATIATVLSQPHGDFEPQQERLTASHDQRHLFSTGSGVIHSVWSFQRERLAVTQFNYDDRNNLVSARISIATRGAQALGKGSTASMSKGTTLARNLREQLAIEQAMASPTAGAKLPLKMTDPRWPGSDGWVKMQQVVESGGREGPINVHYLFNEVTKVVDDFKIVLPGRR